jgi:mannosyltransferase OCH1-like enzyme
MATNAATFQFSSGRNCFQVEMKVLNSRLVRRTIGLCLVCALIFVVKGKLGQRLVLPTTSNKLHATDLKEYQTVQVESKLVKEYKKDVNPRIRSRMPKFQPEPRNREHTAILSTPVSSTKFKATGDVEPLVLKQALEFLENRHDSNVTLIPKIVHQQYSSEKNVPRHLRENMEKFKTNNPDYLYLFWGDAELEIFVKRFHPFLYQVYTNLPQPILKADLARYLLLETFGGVYSDLDTVPLRPLKDWADGHEKQVGFMAGIEVDTTREDWRKWYPRSLGLCQWTFAAAPGHPILSKTIYQAIKNVKSISISNPIHVVEMTGPAVWTDAILDYLLPQKVVESDLRNMETPKLFGDVYVLPITAFSPGVGHMNAKEATDKEARVKHLFEGGWKAKKTNNKP